MILALLAAAAATPAVAADLRCFAALAAALSDAPEAQRPGLIGGVMYFMGRVDAAAPGLDYRAEFTAMMAADPDARTIDAERPRCLAVMKERGESLVTIGEALSAKSAK